MENADPKVTIGNGIAGSNLRYADAGWLAVEVEFWRSDSVDLGRVFAQGHDPLSCII